MKISLCVATRGADLHAFFDSLRQLRHADPWELLLVLNGPSPLPANEVARLRQDLPVTVLHEPRPGKCRALNRALDAATGDLLVFTDDDVEHAPDWLDQLGAAARADPQAVVFGGPIRPQGAVPGWIRRSSNLQGLLLCEQDLGDHTRYPPGVYPYGPNLAVRSAAVASAGARWPVDIGPGTRLPVGDEYAFLAQISAPDSGDRAYVPHAVVHHRAQPRYFSIRGALGRCWQCGLAAGRLDVRFGRPLRPAAHRRALERLLGLRSLREAACVAVRALGFARGRQAAARGQA